MGQLKPATVANFGGSEPLANNPYISYPEMATWLHAYIFFIIHLFSAYRNINYKNPASPFSDIVYIDFSGSSGSIS